MYALLTLGRTWQNAGFSLFIYFCLTLLKGETFMEPKDVIHCEDCEHRFKCHRSKTGYACEVWGYDDFACDVPPDGFCHKAKPRKEKNDIPRSLHR